MRGGGERSQSGISLFVTAGDCPAGAALPPGEGVLGRTVSSDPDRRSAIRFQPSDFFRARLAAKALASGSSAAPGCRNRGVTSMLRAWSAAILCSIWATCTWLAGFGGQVASQASGAAVLKSRAGERIADAGTKIPAGTLKGARQANPLQQGSNADEAMPEAGENAAARASMELSAARVPIGSCRPGLHQARQAPEHGPQTGFGAAG